MSRTVDVKCMYFQVRMKRDGVIENQTFDLRDWINMIIDIELEDRCKNVDGIKGRLEEVVQTVNGYYALNFMRMDDYSSSYILTQDGAAEHIDIDPANGEYIAKNTVALYDVNNSVLMIQSNRGSYGAAAIQSYINSFYEGDACQCALLAVHERIDYFADRYDYTKIDLRLANLRDFHANESTTFEKVVDACNEVEGVTMHLEIGLGREHNNMLDKDEVQCIMRDITREENRHCVSGAKIKMSDDNKSKIYDLLDNLCNDMVKCLVGANGGITFDYMAQRMEDTYDNANNGSRTRVAHAILEDEENNE